MSIACKRLHELVGRLPEIGWPFKLTDLPNNGIYFFHEEGETWGHGTARPRIVRVGTHREGNFRSRIADHYLIYDRKMDFTIDKPAPKDRSIFRKNLGRALLHKDQDPYEEVWNIDCTTSSARLALGPLRNVEKEREVEREITRVLREHFTFRYIELEGQERRMGHGSLEATFIATLAQCERCGPSAGWLGRHSPKPKIVRSGLWLEQHLDDQALTEEQLKNLAVLFD